MTGPSLPRPVRKGLLNICRNWNGSGCQSDIGLSPKHVWIGVWVTGREFQQQTTNPRRIGGRKLEIIDYQMNVGTVHPNLALKLLQI
jgi:hypothetical protein